MLVAAALPIPATAQQPPAEHLAPPQTCTLESGPIRTVARVLDGETLQLDDGTHIRLIGALAPRASDAGAARDAWPAELNAVRLLSSLALGKTVKLAYSGRQKDRYGRHLAHVFLNAGNAETWLQGELLAAGAARAYGIPGSFACGPELLAHEKIARAQRRGLWDTAIYQTKPAHLVALLMSRRSRFEIVEGTVTSVSRTKSGVYVNFGSDWKVDFTARIGKDVLAAHPEIDSMLTGLEGKKIAVRGWIERRNGPMIDIRDAMQLQLPAALQPSEPALSSRSMPNAAEPATAPAGEVDNDGTQNEKRPASPDGEKPGAVDL